MKSGIRTGTGPAVRSTAIARLPDVRQYDAELFVRFSGTTAADGQHLSGGCGRGRGYALHVSRGRYVLHVGVVLRREAAVQGNVTAELGFDAAVVEQVRRRAVVLLMMVVKVLLHDVLYRGRGIVRIVL